MPGGGGGSGDGPVVEEGDDCDCSSIELPPWLDDCEVGCGS